MIISWRFRLRMGNHQLLEKYEEGPGPSQMTGNRSRDNRCEVEDKGAETLKQCGPTVTMPKAIETVLTEIAKQGGEVSQGARWLALKKHGQSLQRKKTKK